MSTTQVYTHLSIGRLKQIHDATHPSAKLGTVKPKEPTPEIPEGGVAAGAGEGR